MIKDITIGQYFPGESFVHKVDPRMKIIITFLFITVLFFVQNFWGFLIAGILLLVIIFNSKISFVTVLKSIKPLFFVIAFTAVFNVIYTKGTPVFPSIGWLSWLSYEGITSALFLIIRIIILIVGTSFLTYTTSPIMLTDALERLLNPLKKIKVPVHELSMMMTIALRFIPTLIEETDKIINAQKARGADFETGGLIKRAKALVPVLIPLIISAFRRAWELADAMECRCYRGGEGRTRYKQYRFGWRDVVVTIIFLIVCTGIVLTNIYLY